jgi:hypothetical protein
MSEETGENFRRQEARKSTGKKGKKKIDDVRP